MIDLALWMVLSLLGPAAGPSGLETPGDGGDADPTTFSFHSDNRLAPLLGPGGEPLRPVDVPLDYGRHYAVHAGGLDVAGLEYVWAQGYGGDHPRLQPRYQDLSRWRDVKVENGWLAIDPTSGRFQFAGPNAVKDPRRLEHRKQIVLGNLTMWRLEARGKFAFTVQEEETHAIQSYDATDPSDFKYGGYSSVGGYPFAMALGETHAYVSGSGYLSVHDIRDPRRLRYVKTIPSGGSEKPFDLTIDPERKLLLQESEIGLQEWDISDADDPVLKEVHEGVHLPWINAEGDHLFGLRKGEGQQSLITLLEIYRRAEGGLVRLSPFPLPGQVLTGRGGIRHLLVGGGLAVVVLSTGLHVVDVKDPARPQRLSQVGDLGPVLEYYEKGSGAHDMALRGSLLFVACGRSRGGWVNPRDTGLFRDHVDFERKVLGPAEKRDIPQRYRGGLRIYDLKDPRRPELVTLLDDEVIGCDAITNVAVGDGVLFLGSRAVGVLAFDLADVKKPRYLGKLSNFGEVDWARLVGDKLYAVSNGVYVIEPYPAEEARLLGFCFTHSMLFGRSVVMNPFLRENPRRHLFSLSGTWHRRLDVSDPARPRVSEHAPPPVGYGRWKGNHIFAPAGGALDVYRIDPEGSPRRVARFPVQGPATHLEIHGDHLYLLALNRELEAPTRYLEVFDIKDPEKPVLVGTLAGPTDTGGMFSPEVYYYRGFLYLPGWHSSRQAGGGKGWGNFLGVRVIDVRDPTRPRLHCLLHHIPADISIDSLNCANSFHAEGDTLYIADYWTGIHVFDIRDLAEKKSWRHLGVIKDRELPWSVSSYATSATGYGRHLYTTHFGHVNIWEIPTAGDVPRAPLTVRQRQGVARR